MRLYQRISRELGRITRLSKPGANYAVSLEDVREALDELLKKTLPSGSGFDAGTKLLYDKSTPERLIFQADFHHMDENGFYDGWTEHNVIVTPSLEFDFNLRVTGRDRNGIKDYISEMFSAILYDQLPE